MQRTRSRKRVHYPEPTAPLDAWLAWGLVGASTLLVIVSAALV